jgi:hypothetical protein
MVDNRLQDAVDKATDSRLFERAARTGYVISGVLHLLIGYIIVRLAFGSGGNADQSGALATLASRTGGAVALWIAAAGFIGIALWRVAEILVGTHPNDPTESDRGAKKQFKRLKSLALAVIYFSLAVSAMRFARGGGKSSGQQNAGRSAQLMQSGWGKALLVAVGVVIIVVGGYHAYKGASRKFQDDLKVSGGSVITPVGVTGYVGKGIVLVGAGVLVVVAALRSDPTKAAGIDAAVKTLGQAPFGKVLLVLAAIGFACYGVYCFALSRFARM